MPSSRQPILVLGAGINGAALARELLLNRVPVVLVDTADVCSGTSAYSSRLIHGGLRYMEFGEFDLVRESLDERTRLLQLAPQYVQPLRLFIPARGRMGGWRPTMARFLFRRSAPTKTPRGMWLVRCGLWLYDRYAADRVLPPHSLHQVGEADVPPVDPNQYHWLCSYSDAQILFPERFVLAMLTDAQELAAANDCEFRLLTYHCARREGRRVEVSSVREDGPSETLEPAAIVNATGAWVDRTLQQLSVPAPRLMGGTRGSHFITYHDGLREALSDAGLYVEAPDGRPIFLLPLLDGVLVGTTDVPFDGDPATARATDEELDYLVNAVNQVMPQIELSRSDVAMHYCGVRPLPDTRGVAAAAITRRHTIHRHSESPLPMYSLIGGKLTTCRALAEETTAAVLGELEVPVTGDSRDRPFPGATSYPATPDELAGRWQDIAGQFGLSWQQARTIWRLLGTRTEQALAEATATGTETVGDTAFPVGLVRWMINKEWVTTLADLVERRLMSLYDAHLTRRCLRQLAGLLVDSGRLAADAVESEVAVTIERLERHFGKPIVDEQFGD